MTTKKQPFTIAGKVIPGMGRSSETGAHTANLDTALAKDLPRGLYSCTVNIQKKEYSGLLYYGYNSLSQKDCLEVHILNFSQNIYKKNIQVVIKKFIRPEKKFKNIKKLKKQITKDLAEAENKTL